MFAKWIRIVFNKNLFEKSINLLYKSTDVFCVKNKFLQILDFSTSKFRTFAKISFFIFILFYWKNHEWLSFYCSESRYSCNIHEVKAQKVCECQDVNLNKNALVLLSSNYINWSFDYLFAKIVLFNILSQHSSVSSAQYFNELSLKFSCKLFQRWVLKLSQRCNFFNDATSSAMRCLKLSSKLSRRDMT